MQDAPAWPGAGSGMGGADLAGEHLGPEQDGGQGGLVTYVQVPEPLHLPALSSCFFRII